MTPLIILLLFLLLQVLLSGAKVIVQEFWLQEKTAYFLEWMLSLLVGLSCYWALLASGLFAAYAFFLALGLGIAAFLISYAIPQIACYLISWAEGDQGVGMLFPVVQTVLLILLFIPTGLGPSIGQPGLFASLWPLFVWAVLGELLIHVLKFLALYSLENEVVADLLEGLLSMALVGILLGQALHSGIPVGQALMIGLSILLAISVEALALVYLTSFYWEPISLGISFWRVRAFLFAGQLVTLFVVYIWPRLEKLIHWIENVKF